ncbi:MAG: ribosome silencing factor [Prosthecobacter sp.]|nr:ribosome silencing factor [Prosthecobacter sp.]
METIEIARLCAKFADQKKAEDIVLLDLRGLSPVADFFVICTATSNPQMRAVRDEIVEEMRDQHGQKPLFSEGAYESQWLIVSYPNVMVHILTPEKREFYSLEELWGDAPQIAFEPELPVAPKKRAAKKAAPAKKAAKKAPAKRATKKVAAKKTARKK